MAKSARKEDATSRRVSPPLKWHQGGKHYLLRSELQGTAGHVFQSAGVAVPPTVQEVD